MQNEWSLATEFIKDYIGTVILLLDFHLCLPSHGNPFQVHQSSREDKANL